MRREYPANDSIPTKIVSLRLKLVFVREMLLVAFGAYNPTRG